MFEFFDGLSRFLPAYTPEFTDHYLDEAGSLAELEVREAHLEQAKRESLDLADFH